MRLKRGRLKRRRLKGGAGLLLWGLLCPFWLFPLAWPGLTAVSLILLLIALVRGGWGNGRSLPITPLNPFILLYLIFSVSAFLVSPLPEHSLPHLILVWSGVVVFFMAYTWLNDPARITWLLKGVVVAGGVLALVGLLTVEWPAQYLFDLRPLLHRLPRLTAVTFLHPNEMAGVVALLLPLVWGVRRLELSRWSRLLLILSSLLMSAVLLFTQSRNAWLALLVAWAVYRLWGRFHFAFLAVVLGLLIAIPFGVNLLPEEGLTLLEQGVTFVDDATKSGEADEPSWLSRLEIWRVAGQMLADYPAAGGGLHTFQAVSRANYVYTLVSPQFNFTHAHNLFLQTAVNLGLLGLLVLLGMWGWTLWSLWRWSPPFNQGGSDWTAVLGAAFTGYLWFNVFDMVSWEQRTGMFIWLLLAAALRLCPPEIIPSRTHYTLRMTLDARPLLVVLVLTAWLILLLSPAGRQNRQNLRLDRARFAPSSLIFPASPVSPAAFTGDARRVGLAHFLRQDAVAAIHAWQIDEQSGPFLRQQGLVAFYEGAGSDRRLSATAVTWFRLALRLDETDGLAYYWLGMAYEAQGKSALALRQYDAALATLAASEPTSLIAEVWEGRGRVLADLTEWQAAADAFGQAAALFPDNSDYAQQLHQVNLLLKEIEESLE